MTVDKSQQERLRDAPLTDTEVRVLQMICAGMPAKQIASKVGLTKPQTDRRREFLMAKTGSNCLAALGAWAERHGYLPREQRGLVSPRSFRSDRSTPVASEVQQ